MWLKLEYHFYSINIGNENIKRISKVVEVEKKRCKLFKISYHIVQMLIDKADDMIYEYNKVIFLFGYVCLFSVTAPLTPLLVILLLWTENNTDLLKMFFYVRIENLEQAIGIGIYNSLMRVLSFIGMITNIGVVLFSKQLKLGDDLFYKIAIFLCIAHLPELKELYDTKYFRRTKANLPHLKFVNDKDNVVNI